MRFLKWSAVVVIAIVIALTAFVATVETRCGPRADLAAPNMAAPSILRSEERRDAVNTYLTYPEWAIVYAYDDFAAVARADDESRYPYFGKIAEFWSAMCAVKQIARSRGEVSADYNAMLYIIGVSFTAEMAIKGAYEKTVGAVTAWIRGAQKTPEDSFALSVDDDYAKFLRKEPWYAYPFGSTLARFWRETPFGAGSLVRSIERRFSLTAEYGLKMPYAKAIGWLAGFGNADSKIFSVIRLREGDEKLLNPKIRVDRRQGDLLVIETPRYQELTDLLIEFAANSIDVVDISGNHYILATLLKPNCISSDQTEKLLFDVQTETPEKYRRCGYDVKVAELSKFLRSAKSHGWPIEHVFDY